jgi:hypothetical protein
MEKLAIILLGLEPSCYAKAQSNEKAYINLVLLSFALIMTISFVATFIIGLFVSGSIFYAFPIMLIGTFVFISIFRFSLILIKPEIKFLSQLNENVIKTTWKEKWQKLIETKNNFIQSLKNFRIKKSITIPGFTFVFRGIYLALLAFVLIFPLTTLFNWSEAMDYNEQLRLKALKKYEALIEVDKNMINEPNDLSDKKYKWYEDKVQQEYFTMQIFKHVVNSESFPLCLMIICIAIFLPHLLLFLMMKNKKYVYVSELNNHFKNLIETDFKRLHEQASKTITKYKDTHHTIDLKFLNKSNPFCEEIPQKERFNVSLKDWELIQSNTAK